MKSISLFFVTLFITLSSCNQEVTESTPEKGFSVIEVESRVNEILAEGVAYKEEIKQTTNGPRISLKQVEVPGGLKVSEVRFSDDKSKIRLKVDYQEGGSAASLSTIMERDEFGLYSGTLHFISGAEMSLKVQEP